MAAGRTFWEWVEYIIARYSGWFVTGACNTMLIALTSTLIGLLIGIIVAVIRTIPRGHNDPLIKKGFLGVINFLLAAYVEIFRGTPMMVQAIIVYYGLMEAYRIDLAPIPAGILVVSINTGAYMAEIVRGGIESIDRGQFEAAHSIGMTHWQTMVNIILPQAIRNILPATGNAFVINIKDTSVLNVISVSELFFMFKSVSGVIYRFFEASLVTCAIYFVLTFTVTRILRAIEKKMDGPPNYVMGGEARRRPRFGGWRA